MSNRSLLSVAIALPEGTPDDTAVAVAAMAGRLGFAAVHLASPPADPTLLERLTGAAAPAAVVVDTAEQTEGIVRVNDPHEVARVRARLDADDVRRPLLVAVPLSIGRTLNEATARADLEPRFAGPRHPRLVGIFGPFERAQEQVLALARAGADGLVLDVPLGRDIADLLAQVRALVFGATPALLHSATVRETVEPPRTVFYG